MLDGLASRYHAALALVVAGRTTQARAHLASFGFNGLLARLDARPQRGRPRAGLEAAQQRREIFGLLLDGAPTREIAGRLGLSERTIKSRIPKFMP